MTNKDYLLKQLRAEILLLRLKENELTEIGIALRFDMVSPETAVQMLLEAGYDFSEEGDDDLSPGLDQGKSPGAL